MGQLTFYDVTTTETTTTTTLDITHLPSLNLSVFRLGDELYLIRLLGTKLHHFEKLGIALNDPGCVAMHKCNPMLEVRLCKHPSLTTENVTPLFPSWPDSPSDHEEEQLVIFRRDRHDFENIDYVDHKGRRKFMPRQHLDAFSVDIDTLNHHARKAENLSPSAPDPFDRMAIECLSNKLIELYALHLCPPAKAP